MPDFSLENEQRERFPGPVVGLDEVGRGPWAGPVVAAAVVLHDDAPADLLAALDDSKKLSPRRREVLAVMLPEVAAIGLGAASAGAVDRLNVLRASMLAMQRALVALPIEPGSALVDGNRLPDLACPAKAVVKGDGRSLSIAAASIAAKVVRDRLMARLGERYPAYGWRSNAGYGTAKHRAALRAVGVTRHHRWSFAPVRAISAQGP